MQDRTLRALAVALIAALPLYPAPTAWAQTESETEAGAADTATEPAGEPEIAPASDPMSSGPKRMKVPDHASAGSTDTEQETGEPGVTEQVVPSADESAEPAASAGSAVTEREVGTEPPAEAAETSDEEMEGDTDVVVTDQAGTGPFVGDYTLGDPSAPVQVIEYASFTCPHCAAYHAQGWPDLKEDFIDTGRIGFTLREVYFDRFGLWASMAARCGGEAAFYPMTDQLLSKQAEWTKAEDIAQAIAAIARRNGLTDSAVKACLENKEFAQLLVEEYKSNAKADEVSSTPTFLVRGPDGTETVVGNQPDELREAIENALPSG